MDYFSPLERSADSLAAIFTAPPDGTTAKTAGVLRLALLRWLLDLPPEIDPALAARILIERQTRGGSMPFSVFAQSMIVEIGRSERSRLPRPARRRPERVLS